MNAVSKAPTDVVALVVATSRQVLIFDSVVAVKRMHIVDAPTKAARWNHHLDPMRTCFRTGIALNLSDEGRVQRSSCGAAA